MLPSFPKSQKHLVPCVDAVFITASLAPVMAVALLAGGLTNSSLWGSVPIRPEHK